MSFEAHQSKFPTVKKAGFGRSTMVKIEPEEDKEKDETCSPGYGFKEDKSVWFKFHVPCFGEIRSNPIVSIASITIILLFVTMCIMVENLPFATYRSWAVEKFSWLYIGSVNAWAIFVVVLYFSKYSSIKLGKSTDIPEYNDSTWFMMLFACGTSIGMFFFGVAEPIYHYTTKNRYSADPTLPDNTLAQIAINLTLFHWGVHGWLVYSLVGLLLALLSYREGLPMTMKSCFYPLIGDNIFGWMGDLIDVISIITTLFGICASLGMGTRILNTGLSIINPGIPGDSTTVQVIIIWCITVVATSSTLSGIKLGIRRLSEICFIIGMLFLITVLCLEDTFFLLNLFVQSLGYYFQNVIQLGFHTDSWEKKGQSQGWKERGRWLPKDVDFADGPSDWIDAWTLFYWGWGIAWCPFVGIFTAKISKGRTIRQFINGTLAMPVLYSFMWLVVFGGTAISKERSAAAQGLCCGKTGTDGWFHDISDINQILLLQNNMNEVVNVMSSNILCKNNTCNDCAMSILITKEKINMTYDGFLAEYLALRSDFGSVSSDRIYSRLSCHAKEQMWFDIMRSYSDIGQFLAYVSFLSMVLYFITSSDSGSLIIDCLAANGDPDPPSPQRVFWSLMEGAMATSLVVAGGKDGLMAMQTAGLLSGLPYTFLTSIICISIWRTVQVAVGDLDPKGPNFAIGLFDAFMPHPYLEWKSRAWTNIKLFCGFLRNIVMAPLTTASVNKRINGSNGSWFVTLISILTFALFILFLLLELIFTGAWAISCFWYLGFVTIMTSTRINLRLKFGIAGNIFEDFCASLLLYPCCALQMELTIGLKSKEPECHNAEVEETLI